MSWQSTKPRQSIKLSGNWWILFSLVTWKGLSPRRILQLRHTLLPSLSCKFFIDPKYSRISRVQPKKYTSTKRSDLRSDDNIAFDHFPRAFSDNRSQCWTYHGLDWLGLHCVKSHDIDNSLCRITLLYELFFSRIKPFCRSVYINHFEGFFLFGKYMYTSYKIFRTKSSSYPMT